MTEKQALIITELIDLLPDGQKIVFREIAHYISELGYVPQKQKVKDFILSFKHGNNEKVIGKMGFRKESGFISLRFFACKSVSEKYLNALRADLDARNGQYSGPLRQSPMNMITGKCGYCGDICTGGGLGCYYKYADGREIQRCGAYPIVIPDVGETDMDEMKKVILEQHNYFLSIS